MKDDTTPEETPAETAVPADESAPVDAVPADAVPAEVVVVPVDTTAVPVFGPVPAPVAPAAEAEK